MPSDRKLEKASGSCSFCGGTGRCYKCDGSGVLVVVHGLFRSRREVECDACEGSGECHLCHGKGDDSDPP